MSDNKPALTMQMRVTPWGMIEQQGRRNLGHQGFAKYTTVVPGLGFIRDKDLNAFISEMIPGNTGREWESETEKGKKPMMCILPAITSMGNWSSITKRILGESIE